MKFLSKSLKSQFALLSFFIFSLETLYSTYNNETWKGNKECNGSFCNKIPRIMDFVRNQGTEVCKDLQTFFSTRTNPLLKKTKKIMPKAETMLKNINLDNLTLEKAKKTIHWLILQLSNSNSEVDNDENISALKHISRCISNYKDSLKDDILYIQNEAEVENIKIIRPFQASASENLEKSTLWNKILTNLKLKKNVSSSATGDRTSVEMNIEEKFPAKEVITYKYNLHDNISRDGIGDAYSAQYAKNLLKNRRTGLKEFNRCVDETPNLNKISFSKWFKELTFKINNKRNVLDKQAFLAWLENVKFNIREVLGSTFPQNNPYIKWSLIAGTGISLGHLTSRAIRKLPIIEKIPFLGINKQNNEESNFFKYIRRATILEAIAAIAYRAYQEGWKYI